MNVHGIEVIGSTDNKTRCTHYASENDIIAIKFRCCGDYYPCYQCHAELANHDASVWRKEELNQKAVLCGCCGYELKINQYLKSNTCPSCQSAFNPGCKAHYHLYFDATLYE